MDRVDRAKADQHYGGHVDGPCRATSLCRYCIAEILEKPPQEILGKLGRMNGHYCDLLGISSSEFDAVEEKLRALDQADRDRQAQAHRESRIHLTVMPWEGRLGEYFAAADSAHAIQPTAETTPEGSANE